MASSTYCESPQSPASPLPSPPTSPLSYTPESADAPAGGRTPVGTGRYPAPTRILVIAPAGSLRWVARRGFPLLPPPTSAYVRPLLATLRRGGLPGAAAAGVSRTNVSALLAALTRVLTLVCAADCGVPFIAVLPPGARLGLKLNFFEAVGADKAEYAEYGAEAATEAAAEAVARTTPLTFRFVSEEYARFVFGRVPRALGGPAYLTRAEELAAEVRARLESGGGTGQRAEREAFLADVAGKKGLFIGVRD